jgi:hypothetical protein
MKFLLTDVRDINGHVHTGVFKQLGNMTEG